MSPLCVNCARVAPGLCAYHIMDLSGCDLDEAEEVSRSTREWYHCPHCNDKVRGTEFCSRCYYYVDPARLMNWITAIPRWRCEDCNAPRIFNPSGGLKPGPCGRCLRRGFSFVAALTPLTPLTPEQLAAWVKGVKA